MPEEDKQAETTFVAAERTSSTTAGGAGTSIVLSKEHQSLEATRASLSDIRVKVKPYLEILSDETNKDKEPKSYHEAQMMVALTVGTLRFMAQRLQGKQADPSLQKELQHMKQLLQRLLKEPEA